MPDTNAAHAPLRRAFLIDAAATLAMAVLLLATAGALDGLLGLPAGLLRWVGLILLPFAVVMAFLAWKPRISPGVAWAFIGCNLFWVADSVLLLFTGWLTPTTLGVAFVLAQAATVAVFAYLQYTGLRRVRTLQMG